MMIEPPRSTKFVASEIAEAPDMPPRMHWTTGEATTDTTLATEPDPTAPKALEIVGPVVVAVLNVAVVGPIDRPTAHDVVDNSVNEALSNTRFFGAATLADGAF